MTDTWTDICAEWDQQAARRAAAEAERAERERAALAKLLSARGQMAAAAIVAMSGWRAEDLGDAFRGTEYQAVLSVPPEGFDAVTDDLRDAIADAAVAVLGNAFTELAVVVRLDAAEPAWDQQLVDRLREQYAREAGATANPVVLELTPGSWDAN